MLAHSSAARGSGAATSRQSRKALGPGPRHIGQVHAHAQAAVAAVVVEAIAAQQQRDERHVRGVHGLQAEARRRAVEVRIGHQVLHGLQHLLQQAALRQACLQCGLSHVNQPASALQACCALISQRGHAAARRRNAACGAGLPRQRGGLHKNGPTLPKRGGHGMQVLGQAPRTFLSLSFLLLARVAASSCAAKNYKKIGGKEWNAGKTNRDGTSGNLPRSQVRAPRSHIPLSLFRIGGHPAWRPTSRPGLGPAAPSAARTALCGVGGRLHAACSRLGSAWVLTGQ